MSDFHEKPASEMTRKQFLVGAASVGLGLGIASATNAGKLLVAQGVGAPPHIKRKRPNILFIMTDQERSETCLPPDLALPARQKIKERGVSFRNFTVTTTPCSPSRSVIYTGQHTKFTKVIANPGAPAWQPLPEDLPTIGHMLRESGYHTAYKGKWHLSDIKVGASLRLEAYPSAADALMPYGFADYTITGDPLGDPWSGFRDDRVTASEAVHWLRNASATADTSKPWFLAVNFVNPHDIMFFDSGGRQNKTRIIKDLLRPLRPAPVGWPYDDDLGYPLPVSYYQSDPATKPWAHRGFAQRSQDMFGYLVQGEEEEAWLRFQNYYFNCIRDVDQYVNMILEALLDLGQFDDTIIVYTSDHGELAGAHGLTQKGPVVYKENLNVPFIVCHPEGASGVETDGLGTALDIAPTLLNLAGLDVGEISDRFPDLKGVSLAPLVHDPDSRSQRDERGSLIYFGVGTWMDPDLLRQFKERHETAQKSGREPAGPPLTPSLNNPALFRAIIHGRYKFARYFKPSEHHLPRDWETLIRHNELVLYDMEQDPDELNNLGYNPEPHRELIMRLNGLLNAAIDAEVGADDGSEFPGPQDRYRL